MDTVLALASLIGLPVPYSTSLVVTTNTSDSEIPFACRGFAQINVARQSQEPKVVLYGCSLLYCNICTVHTFKIGQNSQSCIMVIRRFKSWPA